MDYLDKLELFWLRKEKNKYFVRLKWKFKNWKTWLSIKI